MSEVVEAVALLIDTENIQPLDYEAVKHDLLKRGRIIVRRAYGEFGQEASNAERKLLRQRWNDILAHDKVKRVNPASHVRGKNACDILLAIEAVDLLHNNPAITTFAIVSSDSDFAPLADRLREAGKRVIGYGSRLTSAAFRTTVDDFTTFEVLLPSVPLRADPGAGGGSAARIYGHISKKLTNGLFIVTGEVDGEQAVITREEAPKVQNPKVGMRLSYELPWPASKVDSADPAAAYKHVHNLVVEKGEIETQRYTGHIRLLKEKFAFIRLEKASSGIEENDVFVEFADLPAGIALGANVSFSYRRRGHKPVACNVKVISASNSKSTAEDPTPEHRTEAASSLADGKRKLESAFDSLILDSSDGWIKLAYATQFLKRMHPDFDVRPFGYTNVKQFLNGEFANTYEVKDEGRTLWLRPHPSPLNEVVEAKPSIISIEIGGQYYYKGKVARVISHSKNGAFNIRFDEEGMNGAVVNNVAASDLVLDRPEATGDWKRSDANAYNRSRKRKRSSSY